MNMKATAHNGDTMHRQNLYNKKGNSNENCQFQKTLSISIGQLINFKIIPIM